MSGSAARKDGKKSKASKTHDNGRDGTKNTKSLRFAQGVVDRTMSRTVTEDQERTQQSRTSENTSYFAERPSIDSDCGGEITTIGTQVQ